MVKLLSSVSNVVVSAKSLFTTSESTRAGRAASPGEDTSAFTEQRDAVICAEDNLVLVCFYVDALQNGLLNAFVEGRPCDYADSPLQ